MPRTIQTERKSTGVPPPRKQNASSYNTKQDDKIIFYNAGLNDSDLVMGGIRYAVKKAENLHLVSNNITLEDGKLVDAILANNSTLKELWLSGNNISDEGVKHLANALKKNDKLKELHLAGNNIGHEGANYIADMFNN